MYNEHQPSRYRREKDSRSEDRKAIIATSLVFVIGMAIIVVEYSGLAERFINSFSN